VVRVLLWYIIKNSFVYGVCISRESFLPKADIIFHTNGIILLCLKYSLFGTNSSWKKVSLLCNIVMNSAKRIRLFEGGSCEKGRRKRGDEMHLIKWNSYTRTFAQCSEMHLKICFTVRWKQKCTYLAKWEKLCGPTTKRITEERIASTIHMHVASATHNVEYKNEIYRWKLAGNFRILSGIINTQLTKWKKYLFVCWCLFVSNNFLIEFLSLRITVNRFIH